MHARLPSLLLLLTACASAPPRPRAEPPDPEPVAAAAPQPAAPGAQPAPGASATAAPATGPGAPAAEATVSGSLDKELIRGVVRRNRGQIRGCYAQALQRSPRLEGKVTVRWLIVADGSVDTSSVRETSANSPELEDCLVRAVRTWRFPRPKGGGVVNVSYPFVFRGGSPGPASQRRSSVDIGISTEDARVEGALGKEAVRQVVRRHSGDVSGCYERSLVKRGAFGGRVVVRWRVDADGRVQASDIEEATTNDPPTEACLMEAVRAWEFPASGGETQVAYPFTFRVVDDASR